MSPNFVKFRIVLASCLDCKRAGDRYLVKESPSRENQNIIAEDISIFTSQQINILEHLSWDNSISIHVHRKSSYLRFLCAVLCVCVSTSALCRPDQTDINFLTSNRAEPTAKPLPFNVQHNMLRFRILTIISINDTDRGDKNGKRENDLDHRRTPPTPDLALSAIIL